MAEPDKLREQVCKKEKKVQGMISLFQTLIVFVTSIAFQNYFLRE